MELVVTGHLLDEHAAAVILEDDEMPNQVKEAALVENAFEHQWWREHRFERLDSV